MQLIPFDSPKFPAKRAPIANPFAAVKGAGGFPVISIKGKVFHIQRSGERQMVTEPNKPNVPARALEVVILAANPNKSKVFYKDGYVEGNSEKPTCVSLDGISPSANAQQPQSKKCAVCPHNAWGSKVSDSGAKGKACEDKMRLAVAPAGQVSDAMLLLVPAGSFKALGTFGDRIGRFGYQAHEVVTEISFDFTVAHQALTFRELGVIPEGSELLTEVEQVRHTDIVKQIIGTIEADVAIESFEPPMLEQKQEPVEAKPAKAAKSAPAPAAAEDEFPAEPKRDTKVGAKPAPKAAVAPTPEPDVADEVEAMVSSDDLDFDDL
jgi:hypothetical protein